MSLPSEPSGSPAERQVAEHVPAFTVLVTNPKWHSLKVVPPYFEAIFDGDKTFEVRMNDRAYQRGDMLRLREWVPGACKVGCGGKDAGCSGWTGRECVRRVSFVYSGDPRFGGIESGYVVLALTNDNDRDAAQQADTNGGAR